MSDNYKNFQYSQCITEYLTDSEQSDFSREYEKVKLDEILLHNLYEKWNKVIQNKKEYEKKKFKIATLETSYSFGLLSLKSFIERCLVNELFHPDYKHLIKDLAEKIVEDEYDRQRALNTLKKQSEQLGDYETKIEIIDLRTQ